MIKKINLNPTMEIFAMGFSIILALFIGGALGSASKIISYDTMVETSANIYIKLPLKQLSEIDI